MNIFDNREVFVKDTYDVVVVGGGIAAFVIIKKKKN